MVIQVPALREPLRRAALRKLAVSQGSLQGLSTAGPGGCCPRAKRRGVERPRGLHFACFTSWLWFSMLYAQ